MAPSVPRLDATVVNGVAVPINQIVPMEAMRDVVLSVNKLMRTVNRDAVVDPLDLSDMDVYWHVYICVYWRRIGTERKSFGNALFQWACSCTCFNTTTSR
jgi:hypothetical protein